MLTSEINDSAVEAFWWFQRWVSGSLHDPDWEEDWLESIRDLETAFGVIADIVHNSHSIGFPLWRYLALSKRAVAALQKTKLLLPHQQHIQSFTISRAKAIAVAEDLARPGQPVIVSAAVPPADVLFGMQDVLASRHPAALEAKLALADWHHQDEVFVRIVRPLPLLTVEPLSA